MLPSPTIVNIHLAPYDEYIGLGSPWGNRFIDDHPRIQSLEHYERRMRVLLRDASWRVSLKALAGKKLGCHCAPKPCHGDILVKLFKELIDGKLEMDDKGTTGG